jgi:hypothetical protein
MRFIKFILIITLLGLTNSCGFVKTAYNNSPAVASWWLDDYFDFTSSQKAVLKPALHQLHDWHRQRQLPEYVAMLQGLQRNVMQDQISAGLACEKIAQIKRSVSEFQLASIPAVIAIAPLLSESQLQYLQKKLEKRARKWQSEWVQDSQGELATVRLEKIEDLAEKIYGDLEDSQRLLLKQDLAVATINPTIRYAEIVRRQEDVHQILTALKNESLSTELQYQRVKAGFERLQTSPNQRYVAYADQVIQHSCEMIAHLHSTSNAKQKQHASDFLEKYRLAFADLSVGI